MEELKSMEDEWLNYLRNLKGDIFEMIKSAIMVAASDHPQEFQNKRDMIAQTLFSCDLIKCTGDGNPPQVEKQRPMIVRIKMNKNHSVKEIDPEQKVENNNNDEVLRLKRILDDESVSESVVLESLKKLLNIRVSVKTLEATGIGISIRVLQKHGSKDVRQIAWALVKKWKGIVDEYINKESSVDSEKVKGVEEKFKAAKRKLHEAYDEADKMKRKRRIQVVQLHELTKKGFLLPK
ncbi:hypothetical protein L1987_01784 [Smallanthus sonchifolius]|uniref:Uncharacterized protein n=1 Tax=Smallanthus sonchifolius TaxID=185202 RepID=A0ACB9K5X0_9ASTR|nr:hypothetical protein L1987_01784 [Smallanthus sonchifolius]